MGRRGVVQGSGALCLVGFLLSAYALYVELAKSRDPTYTALCDISPRVSCSLVFTSKYGTGFGIMSKLFGPDSWLNVPNGVFGLFTYPTMFLTSAVPNLVLARIGVVLGVAGVLMSLYLGYVLFFILEDFCVVCISSYVVNILFFFVARSNLNTLKSREGARKALKKDS